MTYKEYINRTFFRIILNKLSRFKDNRNMVYKMQKLSHPIIHVLLPISLLLMFTISNTPFSQANSTTTLYVDPPSTTVNFEENFSINATVANVTDLGGWEFKLYYRNNVLNWISATEGPFLKQGGSTSFFIIEFNNNYNETHGRVWITCVLLGGVPGVSGSGTLTTINFTTVGSGTTSLHLADTVLGNSTANPIPHATSDGAVQVIPPVTITNITAFAAIAAQGFLFPINITTLNESNDPATFNLTLYYNGTEIDTKTITQTNGTSITTTFTWNTTEVPRYQNYTISANTTYSTLNDGKITIVYPGDIDIDRDVDIFDIVALSGAYGTERGDPTYNSNYDINCDRKIDIYDIVIAAGNYGYQES